MESGDAGVSQQIGLKGWSITNNDPAAGVLKEKWVSEVSLDLLAPPLPSPPDKKRPHCISGEWAGEAN